MPRRIFVTALMLALASTMLAPPEIGAAIKLDPMGVMIEKNLDGENTLRVNTFSETILLGNRGGNGKVQNLGPPRSANSLQKNWTYERSAAGMIATSDLWPDMRARLFITVTPALKAGPGNSIDVD